MLLRVVSRRLIILLLLLSKSAFAQEGTGYVFVGPGASTAEHGSATLQAGLGGELVWRYAGLTGELSYLAPQQTLSNAAGVFSVGPSVHIPWRGKRSIDPYILGGYTLFFYGQGARGGGNYGGGVNWWFNRDVGLKLEFRDQVAHGIQYWGFRFGLTFHSE
jgi:hypothetical protein